MNGGHLCEWLTMLRKNSELPLAVVLDSKSDMSNF